MSLKTRIKKSKKNKMKNSTLTGSFVFLAKFELTSRTDLVALLVTLSGHY